MKDSEIDRLIRLAQPGPVPGAALAEAGQELLEEIMSDEQRHEIIGSTQEPAAIVPAAAARRRSPARRRLVGLAAAAAVVAAVVTPALVFGRGGAAATPAAAPAAVTVIPETDETYFLMDDPAWTIDYVSERSRNEGEIRFVDRKRELEINWYPNSNYQNLFEDRSYENPPRDFTFLGREGSLFRNGDGEFEVMVKYEKTFVDVRTSGTATRADLDTVLAGLRQVTVEQWYAGLPESVVTPDETTRVARQMLEDIPVPEGFDASVFDVDFAANYYQFGARVTGTLSCLWFQDYEQARAAGDQDGMTAAGEALAASKQWKVLGEMEREGAWGQVLGDYVHQAVAGDEVSDYRSGLGCDDWVY
ncbi:hypothetical protein KIH74_29235 [Kineosporia sp. J2-2]|uniref:Uncharacterized protein n=1 Tax=Kineosporia corallincola TaxID=2835133 RepID=A0ABS5TQF6_9ACTN|nr:hypothetical protein [Kineosporia corallincola]MBT0773063.1 hypothetical protein [Kineosporia corallincola]